MATRLPRCALLLALSGCDTSNRERPSQAKDESASVGANNDSVTDFQDVDSDGSPLRITGLKSAQLNQCSHRAGHASPLMQATKIGQNQNSFAVYVRFDGVPANAPDKDEWDEPVVQLAVDGCPVKGFRLNGLVRFGAAESRLIIPRAAMPRGDLYLNVGTKHGSYTMYLRNSDSGIEPMLPEEMAGVIRTPPDPDKGEPGVISYPVKENCP